MIFDDVAAAHVLRDRVCGGYTIVASVFHSGITVESSITRRAYLEGGRLPPPLSQERYGVKWREFTMTQFPFPSLWRRGASSSVPLLLILIRCVGMYEYSAIAACFLMEASALETLGRSKGGRKVSEKVG